MGVLLPRRPHRSVMVSRFLMAQVARIELAAALEPDGNDVELCPIVHAPRLVIHGGTQNRPVDGRRSGAACGCLGGCPGGCLRADAHGREL
jgi:hypothetical protein